MKNFDYQTWKKAVMDSAEKIAIPLMTHPGIEYIGAKVRDACFDGEIQAQAICALNNKFPAAAATGIMDLTLEAEAFGAQIIAPDNEIPAVTGRLLSCTDDIQKLPVPSLKSGRMQEYIKANRLIAERIEDKPVFSGCIGPYSLAARLYDMTEIMMTTFLDPDSVKLLLEKCSDFILSYCKELKSTGSNGVIMAEPAAGLMSNEDCMQFSTYYIKKIVEQVQDNTFTVILHNCGTKGHCLSAMIESGANVLHFGNAATMKEVAEGCPSDTLIMGNIDPVSIIKRGNAKNLYNNVKELLNEMKGFPNFILSTGCDIPASIPEANISAFYQALKDYNESLR